MVFCTQILSALFSCRKENLQLHALIQNYPDIDARSIVGPYLKRNLRDGEFKILHDRVVLENGVRDELGNDLYQSTLRKVNSATLTYYASDEDAFGQYIRMQSGGNLCTFEGLSLRQKAILLALSTPKERLKFDALREKRRLITLLEKERFFAARSASPEAAQNLAAEIEAESRSLENGGVVPLQRNRENQRPLLARGQERYTVYRIGDVLHQQSGKFAIIDWTDVPAKVRPLIEPEFTQDKVVSLLAASQPGKPLNLGIAGGQVHLFYETVKSVNRIMQDLDFNQGSRLAQKSLCDAITGGWLKELSIGDYGRIPRRTDKNAHTYWTLPCERTATVDRQEAILTMQQLRDEILQGRSNQLDWNTYLQVSDYIDAIKLHDLQRTQVGYLNDPEFSRAIDEFNETSICLDKLIKDRILLNFLEENYTNEAGRKFDLVTGIKLVAEIAALFQNWVSSIGTVLQEIDRSSLLKADFQWFERELRRILPQFRAFMRSLPPELLLINRKNPDQIRADYSEQDLKNLINATLNRLNEPFYQLFPTYLFQLQIAQKGKTFEEAQKTLFERHKKKVQFINAAATALPNAFQVPTRIEGCIRELARALSSPSSLQLKVLKTYQMVKQKAFETEKMRVMEGRRLLSGYSKERALNLFYPTLGSKKIS